MVDTVQSYLQRTSPESQGLASAAVLQFVEAAESQIHELHSFMLLRHGKVVAEGWWTPYGPEYPHMLFSLSKSFTSTAVGLAVAEGRLSVDDLVLSFFPDDAPAEVNEHLAAMRVRHLLSMSTGHATDTTGDMVSRPDNNWIKGFLEVPVLHEPGTHFLYNTGATYMLSAIVQKLTGQNLVEYLTPRLFEPLGIEGATWLASPQGISVGGWGLNIKTEDIACFGQLYLQKGLWEGNRILSEAWVEEATAYHVSNGDGGANDWAQGYGYQFWRSQHNAYRGDGAFGQYCIVMPDQDAVLAITSGVGNMQEPLNLVWDILVPALGAEALPDDPAAQASLTTKLASLSIPPVAGSASSPLKVSGQTYQVEASELDVKAMTLNFTESGCTITFKQAAGEERITCGYGVWQAGQTKLFNEPWAVDPKPIVASGAWTADDTWTMVVRLYETPFYHTLVCQFAGDQLNAETWVNVGFAPPKRIALEGKAV